MTIFVTEMPPKMIGIKKSSEYNPKDPLQKARVIAQTLGANYQDDIAQAVHGDPDDLAAAYKKTQTITDGDFDMAYKLLSWLSYNVGRGDPNCANYANWAGLMVEGNFDQFKAGWHLIKTKLADYNPARTPVHQELQEIIDNKPFSTHFTAMRIPRVTLRKNSLMFEWPDLTGNLVGTPTREIKL
ncbi:MAG: hypothetical protein ACOYUB_00735 [Patescibacteria group bacterium]